MEPGDVIGCPSCQAGLEASLLPVVSLRCTNCGESFAVQGDVPLLFRKEDADRLGGFGHEYRQARQAEGWQPLTAEEALRLPYARPGGTPALYWQVRRQSFCALMGILAREGPSPAQGPAADLGAGTGWLSYRLAQLGYQVTAVDASRDRDWGLGLAERVYLSRAFFRCALADLEHPPLRAGSAALVLFNASLHYAADLEGTLDRAARALRPGGRIVILDTPVGRRPVAGGGHGDRHLGRRELQQALLAAGLTPRWHEIRRGTNWWFYRAKAWLKRDPLFSFPMIDCSAKRVKGYCELCARSACTQLTVPHRPFLSGVMIVADRLA